MNFLRKGIAPLFLMLAVAAAFSSCNKYEEGPGFSLRSPEGRIINTWVVDRATDKDGNNITSDYDGVNFRFSKDGVLTRFGTDQGVSYTFTGTWTLNDDKTEITLSYSYTIGGITYTFEETYLILRLTKKEFWMESKSDQEMLELVPAA